MADWKHTVELGDLHRKFDAGEIGIETVALGLAGRLKETPYAEDLADLIDELEMVSDVEDYDYILEQVYDFGDADHQLWINTF